MTLTQLRTFLAIADTGSVHAAAAQLVVTPSAVSASMAVTQRALQVRLVARAGRGLRLTEAGEIYADYARRILGLLDEAGNAAAAEADPAHGELRVGALTTAGEQILPHVLAGFRRLHPHVGVRLEVGNRDRVRGLLDRHEVDLMFGGRPETDRDLTVLAIRPHELILVARPGEAGPPAQQDCRPWLARQTWLLREPGSGTREATETLLADLDLDHPPRILTVGSNAAIRESVIAGLGVTLLSRDAVTRELADGRLVEVQPPGTPLARDWHLMANPGRLNATAASFVKHLLTTGEFRRPVQSRMLTAASSITGQRRTRVISAPVSPTTRTGT
ncbi:MAG: LysR family transcriptional regulator [Actinophytocola sp.]|nr:LysR family transcriptional regulator [Actinophytocola sp.]